MNTNSIIKPIYQQIAIDIANRIVSNDIPVGSKIHGRSTLAGKYNVSPETIRRALILLQDMNIVSVSKGSGVFVQSKEEAYRFIDKFKDVDSISFLKKQIFELIDEKEKLDQKLEMLVKNVVDYSERFRNSTPFVPLEFTISKDSWLIDKTISEVNFWQNTGATVIGIRRNNHLILSPGPYATFLENDIFIVVVQEDTTYERIKKYISESN